MAASPLRNGPFRGAHEATLPDELKARGMRGPVKRWTDVGGPPCFARRDTAAVLFATVRGSRKRFPELVARGRARRLRSLSAGSLAFDRQQVKVRYVGVRRPCF